MPEDENKDTQSKMTISLPQSIVVAVVTAILASAGTSGGLTLMSGSTPQDVRSEVISLQSDIRTLSQKVDDIYTIVDQAHPRAGVSP
jgi:hypothetical protein